MKNNPPTTTTTENKHTQKKELILMTVAMIPDLSAILGWGHSDLSVSACVNRTFQRRDSCWAC